jgi:hypothetical protein
MIKKYIKKPIPVDAVQFFDNGSQSNYECIRKEFCNRLNYMGGYMVDSLEGLMSLSDGDYIVKGIRDEFYPVKKEIFEATYEEFKL